MREDKVKPSFFQYFILFILWRLGNGPRKIFADINENENTKIFFFTISNTLVIAKLILFPMRKFSLTFRELQLVLFMQIRNLTCITFFQRGQCILFSVVFTPSSPRNLGSFRALPVLPLFLTNTANASAGLTNHMMGEVSWDPKRRRQWASQQSILSAFSYEEHKQIIFWRILHVLFVYQLPIFYFCTSGNKISLSFFIEDIY